MKKIVTSILVLMLCLSLFACGGKNKKRFVRDDAGFCSDDARAGQRGFVGYAVDG